MINIPYEKPTTKESIDAFFSGDIVISEREQREHNNLVQKVMQQNKNWLRAYARRVGIKMVKIEEEDMKLEDIQWVCYPCGNEYGTSHDNIVTCHEGTCSICGNRTVICAGRNYQPYDEEKLEKVSNEHQSD